MACDEKKIPLINRFNLNRASLIEASAGTGKTFTISNLIVRLLMGAPSLSQHKSKDLLDKRNPLDIENILVVTFTNAAAADLRARILEKIHEIRVFFEKLGACDSPEAVKNKINDKFKGKENDPLAILIDSYFGVLKDAKDVKNTFGVYVRLLKRAETSIDNAPISTIHSFCNKALNKIFTFEAGRAFNVELTQDTSKQEDEAKNGVFRELFYTSKTVSPEILKEITKAKSPSCFDDVIKRLKKVRLLDRTKGYYGFSVLFDKDPRDNAQRSDPDLRLHSLIAEYEREKQTLTERCVPLLESLMPYAPRLKLTSTDEVKFNCSLYENSKGKNIKSDYKGLFISLESLLKDDSVSISGLIDFAKNNKDAFTDIPNGACCRYLSYAKTVKEKDFNDYMSVESFECHLQELLGILHSNFNVFDAIKEEVSILAGIKIIERFDEICARDSIISNDDLLRELAIVLSKKDDRAKRLCSLLRNAYPVAMIDEFQDTDPVQFEIFNNLYLNEDAKKEGAVCYLIGDPKQSIYAFRGSDINSYNRAKENILKLNGFDVRDPKVREKAKDICLYDLDTNFRSSEKVIKAVNSIFSQEENEENEGYLKKPFDYEEFSEERSSLSSNIDFEEVKAASEYSKCGMFCVFVTKEDAEKYEPDSLIEVKDGENPGTYRILKGNFLKETVLASGEKENKTNLLHAAAKSCADDICQCLTNGYFVKKNSNGDYVASRVNPKDIAVLVSDKKQNDLLREALESYGIKSVYLSDDESVLSNYKGEFGMPQVLCPTRASEQMLYLMEAVISPASVQNALRLLASDLLLLSKDEFREYYESEDALNKEMTLLKECNKKWTAYGFMPAFYHYLKSHKCFNRILRQDNGARNLTDYNHIAEIMQSINSSVKGLNSQLLWFKEVINSKDKLSCIKDTQKRLESESDLVKVITVHKSKGLQYPLVFLPFIYVCQKQYDFSKSEIAFSGSFTELKEKAKEAHASFAFEAMILAKKELCSHSYATLEAISEVAKNQEQVRLLYVALTRAQAANFIYFDNLNSGNASKGEDSALKKVVVSKDRTEKKAFDSNKEENYFEKVSDVFKDAVPDMNSYRIFIKEHEKNKESLSYGFDTLSDSIDMSFKVTSYTAIASGGHVSFDGIKDDEGEDASSLKNDNTDVRKEDSSLPQFAFTNGANIGTFLHKLLEIILSYKKEERDCMEKLSSIIQKSMVHDYYHVIGSAKGDDPVAMVCSWMNEVLNTSLPGIGSDFTLNSLESTDSLKELDYFLPVNNFSETVFNEICREFFEDIKKAYSDIEILNKISIPEVKFSEFEGYIKGSIDLVTRAVNKDGREYYYLIDYKSNNLGPSLQCYDRESTILSFIEHKYYVQVLLYTLALHRFLSVAEKDYDYDRDFGSVMYLFLRGMDSKNEDFEGIFNIKPRKELIEKLSAHFAQVKETNNEE